jgi:hypothetical protein
MKRNKTKTAFHSLSLAQKTIHQRLRYKGAAPSQSNEFKYLGVTFDNKLNWKNNVDKVASRVSKHINVLKRVAGNKWGCERSTLNLTSIKCILPAITYSCVSPVTAQPHTLQVLQHAQNQTLRLITGAVKTTPIDAMLSTTGNKPIQELIKEKAVLLREKLFRIPTDQYWKTHENKPRNLKTQNGFIQTVTGIKTKIEIKSKPKTLHQRRNPVDIEDVKYHLHLQQNIIKGETEILRHLTLEAMNTRYRQDKWLHIFTFGSQIEGYINAGARIHCELFSWYIPLGQNLTAFDGEIEATRITLHLVNLNEDKFEKAVIFSNPKAAILSAASTETKISTEATDCQSLIRQLKGKHKQIALHSVPGQCHIAGNEQADVLAKKGAKITQTHIRETPYHFQCRQKNQLDVNFCILYFSSNSFSTCFGQPCAHHQELTTA